MQVNSAILHCQLCTRPSSKEEVSAKGIELTLLWGALMEAGENNLSWL